MSPRSPAAPGSTSARRQRALWERTSIQGLLAAALALLACAWLARMVIDSEWVMDADEAVHAVEALRRFDRLEHGRIGQFLVDSYLPERWQPPVQDHVRWYAIVHSWSLLPAFALLGPSDVSARLVSVLYLLASCGLVFALARRLAPRAPAWGGFAAVALLLSAPNVITFTPQALTEPCTLFWCLLALYAYVRFVETPQAGRRAVLTGTALAVCVLTKYDHGILLGVCLGVAELVRLRGRVDQLLKSPALWVFAIPVLTLGLWLAHPDKLQAFRDTLAHPAYGTWRVIAAEFLGSWIYEYTSSLGALALIGVTFVLAWRRLDDPRLRAVWIYAALSALLLTLRARFHFRYNLIEVPVFFVLAGALAPDALWRLAGWMASAAPPGLRRTAVLGSIGGALTLGFTWIAVGQPGLVQRFLRALLGPLLGDTPGRFGLSRSAEEYALELQAGLQGYLSLCGISVLTLGAALLGLAAWAGLASLGHLPRARHLRALLVTLGLATLPGTADFWSRADAAVRWEWEGTPELQGLMAKVAQDTPLPATVLLGGGWDQLTNNTLRWYLLTRHLKPRPAYDDVQVVGDMIGSLVLGEAPRIAWWARVLREEPIARLPERVVLLDWREDFLYEEDLGPEVALYRAILEQREAYERRTSTAFDGLGLGLEVWTRRAAQVPPLSEPRGAAASSGTDPSQRSTTGRWSISDRSWRHLDCPWPR